MASEQFSLCWDNFHKNMSSGMNSLLESEDLVDVTLAVQGKCLKAHKMVLSVCSPYFKELFKSNPCQHPIVFMKDVSYEALSDLLQFMYQGEVQVSQENLTTFIKTAEALQIKGLTGDGNGSTENDVVEVQPEKHTLQIEEYKTVPRPKKQQQPPPAPMSSPSVKRQRLSVSSNESQPLPPQTITKTEPIATPQPINIPPEPAAVHFKMEPYDSTQNLIDESGDDNFGDDTLDETAGDDTEDYSMMEGGTGEEEPQAGTSADGAGEGQDFEKMEKVARKKRISSRTRFVYQGFVYHNNVIAGTPPLRYLGCAEHKKSGCRGRATVPVGGWITALKMTRPHNHPPDLNAEEKEAFLKELKSAVRSESMANATLKKVYETVAAAFLTCTYQSGKCPARAYIPLGCDPNGVIITKNHNHDPDLSLEKKAEIWKILKQFSMALPGSPEIDTKDLIRRIKRKPNMPRYIVDGFVFHVNITKGNPPMIYLRCLEYKRLGCRARAIIPYDGSIHDIRVNKPHNHPPDHDAEEKIVFLRELKEVLLKNPNVPSRTVYATLSEMYPNAAREFHFDTIRNKMNRWRKSTEMGAGDLKFKTV